MDSKFNFEMVLLARQLRKISQENLSKLVSITQGHLSKIENGLTEPSEDVIEKIASILGFPKSFFYQNDRVYGLPPSFHPMHRKKASVGQHAVDFINAEINIRMMNLRRLLKSVSLKNEFLIPEFDIDQHNENFETIAELVRRTWLLPNGPLKNLTEAIEQAGCIVVWCDFPTTSIDGITLSSPGLPPCIFLNQSQPADRMRFTLAHELGHLVMHRIPTAKMEQEANAFASAMLMPAKDIRASLSGKITLPRLASLKPVWRVSMQAILMRGRSLGLITDTQERYLWQQIGAYGFRNQEPAELDFPREEPTILETIFKGYLNKLGYSVEEIAKFLNLYKTDLLERYRFLIEKPQRKIHLVS